MRVVLTGATGNLGAYLTPHLVGHGQEVVAWGRMRSGHLDGVDFERVELGSPHEVRAALDRLNPDAVLHAGAMAAASEVFRDPERAWAVNVGATSAIASWCGDHHRRLLFVSTDLVFDGSRAWNREDDPAEPVLAYGRTKRAAEPFVLNLPLGLVARLSLLYGPSRCGRPAFFDREIEALARGEDRAYFEDEFRTPLYLGDAAEALALLLESDTPGLIHVGGAERMSRFELMRRAADALALEGAVSPARQADAVGDEPRPADVSLATDRLIEVLPGLVRQSVEDAL
jgi:dTDP-4-dehydrorhamnose reductase